MEPLSELLDWDRLGMGTKDRAGSFSPRKVSTPSRAPAGGRHSNEHAGHEERMAKYCDRANKREPLFDRDRG